MGGCASITSPPSVAPSLSVTCRLSCRLGGSATILGSSVTPGPLMGRARCMENGIGMSFINAASFVFYDASCYLIPINLIYAPPAIWPHVIWLTPLDMERWAIIHCARVVILLLSHVHLPHLNNYTIAHLIVFVKWLDLLEAAEQRLKRVLTCDVLGGGDDLGARTGQGDRHGLRLRRRLGLRRHKPYRRMQLLRHEECRI